MSQAVPSRWSGRGTQQLDLLLDLDQD